VEGYLSACRHFYPEFEASRQLEPFLEFHHERTDRTFSPPSSTAGTRKIPSASEANASVDGNDDKRRTTSTYGGADAAQMTAVYGKADSDHSTKNH